MTRPWGRLPKSVYRFLSVDTAENGPKVKVWSNELLVLLILSPSDPISGWSQPASRISQMETPETLVWSPSSRLINGAAGPNTESSSQAVARATTP